MREEGQYGPVVLESSTLKKGGIIPMSRTIIPIVGTSRERSVAVAAAKYIYTVDLSLQ